MASRHLREADGMPLQDAVAIVEEAEGTLRGREVSPDTGLVFELVRGSGRSSYDCECGATALQLDVRLVTADRRLADAFPEQAIGLSLFAG
jgi:hypothetical protein